MNVVTTFTTCQVYREKCGSGAYTSSVSHLLKVNTLYIENIFDLEQNATTYLTKCLDRDTLKIYRKLMECY